MTTTRTRARSKSAGLVLATVVAAALPLALASPASAKGGGGVSNHGTCSGGSTTWKLKAKSEDGGKLEVEFEIDSNHVGQTWAVRLSDNGHQFFAGDRTTKGPSGSFTVHRLTNNRLGSDVIRGRATRGSHVCAASVTF